MTSEPLEVKLGREEEFENRRGRAEGRAFFYGTLAFVSASSSIVDWVVGSGSSLANAPILVAAGGFAYEAFSNIKHGSSDGRGYVLGIAGLILPGAYELYEGIQKMVYAESIQKMVDAGSIPNIVDEVERLRATAGVASTEGALKMAVGIVASLGYWSLRPFRRVGRSSAQSSDGTAGLL